MKKTLTLLFAAASMAMGAQPIEMNWIDNTAILDAETFANDNISVVFTMDVRLLEGKSIFEIEGMAGEDWKDSYGLTHYYDYYEEWGYVEESSYVDGLVNHKDNTSVCSYNLLEKKPVYADVVYSYTGETASTQVTMYLYDANGNELDSYSNSCKISKSIFYDFISIKQSDAIMDIDVYNVAFDHQNTAEITAAIQQLKNPSSPNVPEPTTATLSLLALAGLAARRRR